MPAACSPESQQLSNGSGSLCTEHEGSASVALLVEASCLLSVAPPCASSFNKKSSASDELDSLESSSCLSVVATAAAAAGSSLSRQAGMPASSSMLHRASTRHRLAHSSGLPA